MYILSMLLGRPLAPDAAIIALSLCFQNDPLLRRSDVYKSCICRGLRKPVLLGASPSKSLGGVAQSPLGLAIRKNDDAIQRDWTDGSAGAFYTQASPREPSASVSVKRPLQRPLEQAITVGDWREAVVLIEKLLLVGSLPDNFASDYVLKGGWCTFVASFSVPTSHSGNTIVSLLRALFFDGLKSWMLCVGLCGKGAFRTAWKLYTSQQGRSRQYQYSTYQALITSAFQVSFVFSASLLRPFIAGVFSSMQYAGIRQ